MAFTIPFPIAAQAACTQSAVISGGSVTLCLNASKISITPSSSTKTVTSVRIPTSVAPPSACPATVSTTTQVALFALRGCPTPRLVVPMPVVAKKTITTTTQTPSASLISDRAAFTPNPVAIVVARLDYLVGESATLISNAITHDRSAMLLGSAAQVRFEPQAQRWLLDGQVLGVGAIGTALMSTVGVHRVELQVDYLASYRFDLSAPFTPAGTITDSAAVSLNATAPAPPVKRLRPHLVSASCTVHPSSYRC